MGIKPTNSGQMIKMEQHASKSIEQKNNNNNDDGSQRKAQSLLHTLLDEVNKDKAQIEESIKQKNLPVENAKADSLSDKRPSTRRSHTIFFMEISMALGSHVNKIDESHTKYQIRKLIQ
jgi:hypothetical protein